MSSYSRPQMVNAYQYALHPPIHTINASITLLPIVRGWLSRRLTCYIQLISGESPVRVPTRIAGRPAAPTFPMCLIRQPMLKLIRVSGIAVGKKRRSSCQQKLNITLTSQQLLMTSDGSMTFVVLTDKQLKSPDVRLDLYYVHIVGLTFCLVSRLRTIRTSFCALLSFA